MISVIGYCYMINDWKVRLERQLLLVHSSGLYENADELFLLVTDITNDKKNEIDEILKFYPKFELKYHNTNWYEGHALLFLDGLARKDEDRKILYFHTKGVFNKFKNFETSEIDNLKVDSVNTWSKIMEHYLINEWKFCIDKLNDNDTVGVTNYASWYWGNFWWANSSYIKNNTPFGDYFGGSRWQCESWLQESNKNRGNTKHYECSHFNFNPFYTIIPEYVYNGTDISSIEFDIISAEYGYFAEQLDEGRGLTVLNDIKLNITDYVNKINFERTNNKNINIIPDEVNINDIAYGLNKLLRITYKTNIDPENTYVITSFNNHILKVLN